MDDGDLVCNLQKMEDKKCTVRWWLEEYDERMNVGYVGAVNK